HSLTIYFYDPPTPRYLPSSPTRRSSDLEMPQHHHRGKQQGGRICHAFSRNVGSTAVHCLENRALLADIAARRHAKPADEARAEIDRKSTRLNSSHQIISYAVFCLKKKKN